MQVKSAKFSSDMANELAEKIHHSEPGVTFDVQKLPDGIKKFTTRVTTPKAARKFGKPLGIYCNIESEKSITENASKISKVLLECLVEFLGDSKKGPLLVVGLGNNRFVADSFGPKVCELLRTGAGVAAFAPGVAGVTGIKSTTAIKAITDAIHPSHVIILDTLCCDDRARLGRSFQISNTGIQPGSGITHENARLDAEFLGVPVVAAGVPLVVHVPELHYVVPKHIDAVVAQCSKIFADAINLLGKK